MLPQSHQWQRAQECSDSAAPAAGEGMAMADFHTWIHQTQPTLSWSLPFKVMAKLICLHYVCPWGLFMRLWCERQIRNWWWVDGKQQTVQCASKFWCNGQNTPFSLTVVRSGIDNTLGKPIWSFCVILMPLDSQSPQETPEVQAGWKPGRKQQLFLALVYTPF